MAKGTNAKIKELKGTKPKKITGEQLKKVQDVVNTLNRSQLEIGSMEIRKHELMHSISSGRDNLGSLQKELEALQGELEKEYGTIDIDIKNGTINYPENGEVNKKD